MDRMRKETDKQLEKMEKYLADMYREAQYSISLKWQAYMTDAEKKLAPLEKEYQEAKASGDKEQIRRAGMRLSEEKRMQTLYNQYYQDMLDYTTEQITHVNEKALAYINDEMPGIYGINYNGTLQDIEKDAGKLGVSFNLVDEDTIKRLAKAGDINLPAKEINPAKDEAWNKKAINSQLLQGILQGESIPEIAQRLQNVTDMNESAAVRNARTMTTEAENGGRLDSMKRAEDMGIVYEKQWLATNDDRTRESHIELDGVSVPIDEEFPNGLQYPGDPKGEPAEVYNCRCTMTRKLIGFRKGGGINKVEQNEPWNPFS